jgi:hypothetical protein
LDRNDLSLELWEIGFDLFRDRGRFAARFLQGNMLSKPNPLWKLGETDIVVASQIFHLFLWEQKLTVLGNLVGLSKKGTMVLGLQTAKDEAQEVENQWGHMYFHDVESFEWMWLEVGK